jgi:hypothetical protein
MDRAPGDLDVVADDDVVTMIPEPCLIALDAEQEL